MTNTTVVDPKVIDQFTQTWLATLDGINRLQEQNEKLIVGVIEANRDAREQARKVTEKMFAQITDSQKNFANLVETTNKTFATMFTVPQSK